MMENNDRTSVLQVIGKQVDALEGLYQSVRNSEERLKQELPENEGNIYKYFKDIRDKIEVIEREQIRNLRDTHGKEIAKLEQRKAEYQKCLDAAQKANKQFDISELKSIREGLESKLAQSNDDLAVKISFNPVSDPGHEMTFEYFTLQPGIIEVITKAEDLQDALGTIRGKCASVTAGQVAVTGQTKLKYKTIFNGRTKTDKRHCWFTGVAILENGSMLLADRNNKKLKLFSADSSLLQEADTDSAPFDLALMDNGVVAVTITKERSVRFIKPYNLSWATGSINTKQNCVGIDYQKGQLFVLCESSFKHSRCIKVYDDRKVFLMKICLVDSMTEPIRGYIKVSPSSGLLYVTRNEFIGGSFIYCCDTSGNILHSTRLQFRDESPALAILSDSLIVGLASGLVSIYQTDTKERCLLPSIDKSVPPCAIAVDQKNKLLILTQASRFINSHSNNFVQLLDVISSHRECT